MNLVLSLLASFGWGTSQLFTSKLSKKLGGLYAGFHIQFFGLLGTALLVPFFLEVPVNINWLLLVATGVVGSIAYILFCKALDQGKLSIVVPISSTWGLISAVLGIFLLGESAGVIKIAGILIIVAGVILLSFDYKDIVKAKFFKAEAGAILAILTSLSWGLFNFLLAPASITMGWFFAMLMVRFFAVLTYIPFIFKTRHSIVIRRGNYPIVLGAVAFDIAAFTFFNIALSKFEVSFVSIIASTSPLISVILAALFLKEKVNLQQKIAIVLSVLGVMLLQVA